MKAKTHQHERGVDLVVRCPGCKYDHYIPTNYALSNGAKWSWNGDLNSPTITPSMNEVVGPFPEGSKHAGKTLRCHFVLNNGVMNFCGDCTHELAGKSIELAEVA